MRKIRYALILAAGAALAFTASAPVARAHDCGTQTHYVANGRPMVRLGANFADKVRRADRPAGSVVEGALAGVEIKLNRVGGDAGPVTRTDSSGDFSAHGCFWRDANGGLPGGGDLTL